MEAKTVGRYDENETVYRQDTPVPHPVIPRTQQQHSTGTKMDFEIMTLKTSQALHI